MYSIKSASQIINSAKAKRRMKRAKKLAIPLFFMLCIAGGTALGIMLSNQVQAQWQVTAEKPFTLSFDEDPAADPAYMGIWYNFTLILNNTDGVNTFTATLTTEITVPGSWAGQVLMYRDGVAMTFTESTEIYHDYEIGTVDPSEVMYFEMAYFIQEGSDVGSYGVSFHVTGTPY